MNPEELKALFDQIKGQLTPMIKLEISEALKGVLKTDELSAKLEEAGLKADTIASLTTAIETQGLEMQKFINGGDRKLKTLKETLAEKNDELQRIVKNGSGSLSFDIDRKTIALTTDVSGNTTALRLPGVEQEATMETVLSALFSHVNVPPEMNNVIRYQEQVASPTRNAAGRLENGAFAESALTWIERTLPLEEIGDSIPASKESLKFVGFMAEELRNFLTTNIRLKVDNYLWKGTGTAPQSDGISVYAPTFDHAAYAATDGVWLPQSANIFDLAMILAEQISNGKGGKFTPNFVLMNKANSIAAKGAKNDFASYLMPPFVTADGKVIDGLRVIESAQVDKGTMLVGDSNWGTIYDSESLTIEMGYIDKQFTSGAITIRAYQRMALLVKELNKTAFLKVTDINAALAAITKPVNG
jgi:hypothetical protein